MLPEPLFRLSEYFCCRESKESSTYLDKLKIIPGAALVLSAVPRGQLPEVREQVWLPYSRAGYACPALVCCAISSFLVEPDDPRKFRL